MHLMTRVVFSIARVIVDRFGRKGRALSIGPGQKMHRFVDRSGRKVRHLVDRSGRKVRHFVDRSGRKVETGRPILHLSRRFLDRYRH